MKSDSQDPTQDPRLTAYALGELTDPKEIEAVETLLRESPALRRELESLRATAEWLQFELEQEPLPSLSHHQLEELEKRPRWWRLVSSSRTGNIPWWFPVGLATTASAIVIFSAVTLLRQETDILPLSARLQRPESASGDARFDTARALENTDATTISDPTAGAPPQVTERKVPTREEKVSSTAPAGQDASGRPLQVHPGTPEPPSASVSEGQSNQRELMLSSRFEDAHGTETETALREMVLPAEAMDTASESGTSPISQAAGSVIEPPAYREERVLDSGETPGGMIVKSGVHPEGFVQNRPVVPRAFQLGPFPGQKLSLEVRARLKDFPSLPPSGPSGSSTEDYRVQEDNPFRKVSRSALSTFGIDVDTASYSNVRRLLRQGSLPPRDAVRIEEMVNYFSYGYDLPGKEHPFSVRMELAGAPWKEEHLLLRIALQSREIESAHRPPSNLVFLLDVSGSMRPANKLPLLKRAMRLLVNHLGKQDRVALVTYAGESEVVLPSTPCDRKEAIIQALESVQAGGPTNGEAGIRDAYAAAAAHFIPGGTNRVILATDGDFNLGMTDEGSLIRLIRKQARSGIYLSVLGLGMGNYKEAVLESLANRGNGNFSYLDSLEEARKVLVREMGATLDTVAKDAKIQIEFNPVRVDSYRLIGYENRVLRDEEFNDDSRDGGEIGAGHQVTVLYEIVPAGTVSPTSGVDPLKYQTPPRQNRNSSAGEWLTLKIRYKPPDQDESRLLEFIHRGSPKTFSAASIDFRFASAVAAFGMILRDSPHRGAATLQRVLVWTQDATGDDPHGHRGEFVRLVRQTMVLEP